MNDLYERTTALGITPKQVDDIAYVAHDAVKAWARSQGDFSHDDWSCCSAEHKDSLRRGVVARLENPDEAASANHDRWLEERAAHGWKYGPVRDEAKKENPAFVPYSDLPVDFRARNEIFMGIVKALDPRKF
jgi:hypothetical protein